MKLWEIAHSRTGDKGNISNVSLIVYDKKHYNLVKDAITPKAVKEWFKDIVKGDILCYKLPKLGAINFVMQEALGGGVTRSLASDKHGKCLSAYLLDMEIEAPE